MRTTFVSSLILGCSLSSPAFAWQENTATNQIYTQTTFLNNYEASVRYSATDTTQKPEAHPELSVSQSVNSLPMHLSVSPEKDWDYLLGQSYTIFGLSLATAGLMTLLPSSITNWDDEDRNLSNLGKKWWDNVSSGPVWDQDDHFLNYVMHPYFGGVYYTTARHSGFNEWESFLYSATMSTFFWEYGVEAFAEPPSIQDIIVTPIFGAAVGEWMLQTEAGIVSNGGEVMGSDTLGNVSLFLLNPVGHIHHWMTNWWQDEAEISLTYAPWFGNTDAANFALDAGAEYDRQFIGLQVSLALN